MKGKNVIREFILLTLGNLIISASVYYLMMPSQIVVGSISGLVMVLSNFLPFKISTMTMVLNVSLLILGFFLIGGNFGIKTVYSSVIIPVFLGIFEVVAPSVPPLTDDIFVNTICHVLVVSFGQAILFNMNASSGGLDIVAKILNKYLHFEIGKSLTIIGLLTAASAILVYDLKIAVVSILGTILCGIVLDSFIDGFHVRKRVCIIAPDYQKVQNFIVNDLKRGATLYPAWGGKNNEERMEVASILERSEYARLIQFVEEEVPHAFVTVSTVSEVFGEWNQNRRRFL